jgi:hypothetical protein
LYDHFVATGKFEANLNFLNSRCKNDKTLWSYGQQRASEGPAKGQKRASKGLAKGQKRASKGPAKDLQRASKGQAKGQERASKGPVKAQEKHILEQPQKSQLYVINLMLQNDQ